ncbi:hypothetical protein BJ944DRAFT_272201 [Cunninghamella echinulata]|nr:hypothetical protein BJ944DRAFT_272201 [Cunninghamella echinulata]
MKWKEKKSLLMRVKNLWWMTKINTAGGLNALIILHVVIIALGGIAVGVRLIIAVIAMVVAVVVVINIKELVYSIFIITYLKKNVNEIITS